MLEQFDVDVDIAQAAEQAIEYLKSNRPDAIFMDRLMPGVEGLQAFETIKGDAQTAMIPVVMYSPQDGELSVGQARALGATGVPGAERPAGAADQAGDLRRFIAAKLDGLANRIVNEVRDSMIVPGTDPLRPMPPAAPPVWPRSAGIAALGLIALALAAGWLSARNDLARARAENSRSAAANAELERARAELSATVKDLSAALAAAAPNNGAAPGAAPVAAPSAPAATVATRIEAVPYGEIPFDHSRLEVLRDMLAKLESQGFHGVVKVTSMAGIFCLSGSAAEGFAPAVPTLPAAKCDLVGNPFDDSLSGQQRLSLGFANLMAGVRQRTAAAIVVDIENAGNGRAAAPYPARSDTLTAGEWNRAAAANNRVEFAAEGSAGP